MQSGSGLAKGVAGTVGAKVLAVFSRLRFGWSGFGALLIGMMLAKWSWVFFAPAAVTVPPAKVEISPEASGRLFGVAPVQAMAASPVALPNVRLLGVFSGQQGFAVLELEGKQQHGVAVGEEVIKGVRLAEAGADYVVIDSGAVRQRIMLENRQAGNATANAGMSQAVPPELVIKPPVVDTAVQEWQAAQQRMQREREMQRAQ